MTHHKILCSHLSYRTTIIILGAIEILLALILVVISSIYAALIDQNFGPHHSAEYEAVKIIVICSAVAAFLQLTASALMVTGAAKSEPYMLLPWLILIPIFIVLYIAGTIYFMFVEIPHEACLLTQFIVIGAITLVVVIHYAVVVKYYIYLRKNQQ